MLNGIQFTAVFRKVPEGYIGFVERVAGGEYPGGYS